MSLEFTGEIGTGDKNIVVPLQIVFKVMGLDVTTQSVTVVGVMKRSASGSTLGTLMLGWGEDAVMSIDVRFYVCVCVCVCVF